MSAEKLVTPLPLSTHYCLRYISIGMIALSSALTTLCVFIIIRTSSKTSPAYARLLLLVTIIPLTSDITFHFLLDPAPLLPLLCIYRWRPIIPIPGSVTIYYNFWVLSISWNACAYAACFIHRHQLVVPPGSYGKFSNFTRAIFLGAIFAFSLLVAPILVLAQLSDDRKRILLNQTSGFAIPELDRTVCYDTGWSYAFIGYSFIGFIISMVFLVSMAIHIFILLRGAVSITLSDKTRSFHKAMTKALVTQAAVGFVFLFLPLVTSFIVQMIRLDISLLYILVFVSTHSLIHSMTVLATTPLYRRAVNELVCRASRKTIFISPHEQSVAYNQRTKQMTNAVATKALY